MPTSSNDRPAILGGLPCWREDSPKPLMPNEAIRRRIDHALADGTWNRYAGPAGEELQSLLQCRFSGREVFLTSSGTVAGELALRAAGIKVGDEVLLCDYEFLSNARNVLAVGAIPILVDCLPNDWMIDPDSLEASLSPRTRAIVVSHLHGHPAPVARLHEWCRRGNVVLIEDVCQSPGSRIAGREAGLWGDVATFSFGGTKLLSAGRGGLVLVRDPQAASRLRIYTNRGNEAYPLSELQALSLLPQWQALDEYNRLRAAQAKVFCEEWARLTGREDDSGASPVADADDPALYKLGLWYESSRWDGLSRDGFVQAARAEGIPFAAGFATISSQLSRARYRAASPLDGAAAASQHVVKLHHAALSGDRVETEKLVKAIRRIRSYAAEIQHTVETSA